MRYEAREEERSIRVCQVLRSGPEVSQEVPAVIERHNNHDETAQDIDGNQARSLGGGMKSFRVDGCNGWRRGYGLTIPRGSGLQVIFSSFLPGIDQTTQRDSQDVNKLQNHSSRNTAKFLCAHAIATELRSCDNNCGHRGLSN